MPKTGKDVDVGLGGRFWLQGEQEDEAVHGHLFLQAGADPRLELDGVLTPLEREVSRRKRPDGHEVRTSALIPPEEMVRQTLVVHGTLDETGEPVTLPSAFTVGWSMRGTGVQGQRLRAFYALLGGHVDGANAQFTRVRVRLRHLDAWAALPGFMLSPGSSAEKLMLAFEQPEISPEMLASGARIALEQEHVQTMPTVCGGRLERRLWLDILDMPPATYRDLDRRIVKPLMNLLTLAVGTESPLVDMRVSTGPDYPWLTVRHAAMQVPAAEIIPASQILLPMVEIGLGGIAAWLDSTGILGPLPSIVARIAASPDDTLEAQLLELTTVAEGLHRLLLPERKRMTKEQAGEARARALAAMEDLYEDVQDAVRTALSYLTDLSYPRRLLDLAEYVGEGVPGVTGDTPEWKKRVTNARNNLAHKLEHGFLDDNDDAEESAAVLASLRWLLTGMLLLQTRISPATLGRCIGRHQQYELFLSQARIWLPSIYSGSEGHTI